MENTYYNPENFLLRKYLGTPQDNPSDELWEVIVGECSDNGSIGELIEIMTYSHYLKISKHITPNTQSVCKLIDNYNEEGK